MPDETVSTAAATSATCSGALRGLSVLLVEDDPLTVQTMVGLLQEAGAKVELALDGLKAREALRASYMAHRACLFDVVLMDTQMPIMDGFKTTRAMRRDSWFLSLPIIGLTAEGGREDQQRCHDAGMNDTVSKSVTLEALVAVLCRWVRPKRMAGRSRVTPSRGTLASLVAEAADGVDLASLVGIDTQIGLARVSGNHGLYVGGLRLFLDTEATAAAEVGEALASGDAEGAAHRIHRSRAAAGNIGAIAVYRAASTLEATLAVIGDHQTVADVLEGFAQALDVVIRSLRSLPGA